MLIQLTGMSGHPLAVEAADVHAVEAIFNDEILLKHADNSVGSRIHCNRHGVTSQFDVRELVEEVVRAVESSTRPKDPFGRRIPPPPEVQSAVILTEAEMERRRQHDVTLAEGLVRDIRERHWLIGPGLAAETEDRG